MRPPFIVLAGSLALMAAVPTHRGEPLASGCTFTWKTTFESADERAPKSLQPSMSVQLAGSRVRMDFVAANPNPMMKGGGNMVLDADKNQMIIVSPKNRTASIIDPVAVGNMTSSMNQGRMANMDVSNVTTDVQDLGAGERILGHPTHRYKIARAYDMQFHVLTIARHTHQESVSEGATLSLAA